MLKVNNLKHTPTIGLFKFKYNSSLSGLNCINTCMYIVYPNDHQWLSNSLKWIIMFWNVISLLNRTKFPF